MKLLLWGAGSNGVILSRLYRFNGNIYNDDIVGVVDSNPNKWGETLFGKEVVSPTEIHQIEWDKIVVTSTLYDKEIKDKLIKVYGVSSSDVTFLTDYCEQKIIHYHYEQNMKNNEAHGKCETYSPFNKDSLVVYTAILGDYDVLRVPKVVESNVHYVCYTDQKNIKSDVWEMRYVDEVPEDARAVCVRKYKMLPHLFFPEYETSIWVDASLQILGRLTDLLGKYQIDSNFLLMPHNERICAYDEAFACISGLFDKKTTIISQVAKYLREGYPLDNGLMMGTFLARNHHDKKVIQTMEDWYKEVCDYSRRDQISLPYAIWKNELTYDLCDLCIFDNPWMTRMRHKHLADARGADR